MKIAKTSKSTFWHLVFDSDDETVCGKHIYPTWETKTVSIQPHNLCEECALTLYDLDVEIVGKDVPVKPDKTKRHSTW